MIHQSVQQSPDIKPRFFYGYIIVAATFSIMVITFGIYTAFGVFFKPVLTELGWTRAMASGAFSLSSIMQGLLGIFMGRLNDRIGPRTVMTLCSLFLGLGYLLMSQLSAVWHLYLFYGVIIGIGMSGVYIPIVSTVARWFARRRSMMTGIVVAGGGIGTLITPPIANWLISTYGWRMSYIILGSTVLLLVLLAARLLRRDPAEVGQIPYGEKRGDKPGLPAGTRGFSLKEAAYTRQFWMFSSMLFCLGFAAYVILIHIVPHAIELGISAASAANILATVGGLMVIGRIVMGTTADRIGNKRALIIGFILMGATLFWLGSAIDAWALYLLAAVFGFGFGVGAVTSPLAAGLFGLRAHGLILGAANFGYTIGGAVGPFLAGYIFDVIGNYQVAFLASAAAAVAGLILALLLKPSKSKHRQDLGIT